MTLFFFLYNLAYAAPEGHGEGAAHGEAGAHGAAAAGEHAEAAAEIPMDTIALQAASLLIFVGLLVWLARRPLQDALRGRAAAVQKSLDEAARVKSDAEARFREIEDRLGGLDAKIAAMRAEAEVDAEAEARRIAARAEADAARIRDTAERTIREEGNRARSEIRREMVAAAAELAAGHIRTSLTPADQARLAREFLGSLGHSALGDRALPDRALGDKKEIS